MKITKRQLKRIIKEEKARMLSEQSRAQYLRGKIREKADQLYKEAPILLGDIELPSEDAVMDEPGVFLEELEVVMEKLEAVEVALKNLVNKKYVPRTIKYTGNNPSFARASGKNYLKDYEGQ